MAEIDDDQTMDITPQTDSELQTAESFVRRNVINAKPGRKCVDGRDESATEDSGKIARPGGDAGYVEALIAVNDELDLELEPEEIVDTFLDTYDEMGETFNMHSDDHTEAHLKEVKESDKSKIGCGHLSKPTDPNLATAYAVDPDKMKRAITHLRKRRNERRNIHWVDLPGEHLEEGVLVITGTQKTVNSSDGRNMYFVYDVTRDNEFIEQRLFPNLKIPGLTLEAFKQASDKQTQATLHNLALGKPVFEVNADLLQPGISLLSRVV